MAYYFMVESGKGKHIPLDITKSKYFTRQSRFKNLGLSLQEIDLFTSMFNDEAELRMNLVKEGILPTTLVDKQLSARILRKNVFHKVMYDFLYQSDIEYLIDPTKIIDRINQKLYDGDYRFVEALASAYLKFYDCSSTAAEVRNHASFSIRYGTRSHYFDELDENQDPLLTRMIKLLIYGYYQDQNGKVTYRDDIKYLNLHSVIAFTNNYDKKHQQKDTTNTDIETMQMSFDESNTNEGPFMDASNVKEKTRKKTPIAGQFGFSEILK